MDPLLALVMANIGLARPNTFVFDPFVGSGTYKEHKQKIFTHHVNKIILSSQEACLFPVRILERMFPVKTLITTSFTGEVPYITRKDTSVL